MVRDATYNFTVLGVPLEHEWLVPKLHLGTRELLMAGCAGQNSVNCPYAKNRPAPCLKAPPTTPLQTGQNDPLPETGENNDLDCKHKLCTYKPCALNGTNENGFPTLKSTASIFLTLPEFSRLRMSWCLQLPAGEEQRFLTTGIFEGRYVTVVYTIRSEAIRIISFRRARHEERQKYQELYSGGA